MQNYGSALTPVVFYVFDVMALAGKDLTCEPLEARVALLEKKVLLKLKEPVGYTGSLVNRPAYFLPLSFSFVIALLNSVVSR